MCCTSMSLPSWHYLIDGRSFGALVATSSRWYPVTPGNLVLRVATPRKFRATNFLVLRTRLKSQSRNPFIGFRVVATALLPCLRGTVVLHCVEGPRCSDHVPENALLQLYHFVYESKAVRIGSIAWTD